MIEIVLAKAAQVRLCFWVCHIFESLGSLYEKGVGSIIYFSILHNEGGKWMIDRRLKTSPEAAANKTNLAASHGTNVKAINHQQKSHAKLMSISLVVRN